MFRSPIFVCTFLCEKWFSIAARASLSFNYDFRERANVCNCVWWVCDLITLVHIAFGCLSDNRNGNESECADSVVLLSRPTLASNAFQHDYFIFLRVNIVPFRWAIKICSKTKRTHFGIFHVLFCARNGQQKIISFCARILFYVDAVRKRPFYIAQTNSWEIGKTRRSCNLKLELFGWRAIRLHEVHQNRFRSAQRLSDWNRRQA